MRTTDTKRFLLKRTYPLDRYAKIRTRQSDEFEQALTRVYGATLHELPNPSTLDVHANFVCLRDIALGFARVGTAVTTHFAEMDYARFQIPLRGTGLTTRGTQSVPMGPRKPCVISPGHASRATYSGDLENLFVRVKSEALKSTLALLVGRPLSGDIEFVPDEFVDPSLLSGQRQIVGFLVQVLDNENSPISPNALRELEEAAVIQLLYAAKHNFSSLLERVPSDADPAAVRRAEAYIEENWRLPVTIETLVEISGVSARTLFRTFAKARGSSPISFLRATRLRQAHSLLSAPEQDTTVTGVALACGFSNLGQFASDYRKAFGELPSLTLQKYRPR